MSWSIRIPAFMLCKSNFVRSIISSRGKEIEVPLCSLSASIRPLFKRLLAISWHKSFPAKLSPVRVCKKFPLYA